MDTTNTKTLLTIKTDKTLKEDARRVAGEIGIPLGTFINAVLKQFVREKRMVFDAGYIANKKTARALKEGEKDFKEGKLGKPVSLSELADERT